MNKIIALLALPALFVAPATSKPDGDTLKWSAGANNKYMDQFRVITAKNDDFAGDLPSVWYDEGNTLGEIDACNPDDVWIPAPQNSDECCNEVRGYKAWLESTDYEYTSNGQNVFVDYLNDEGTGQCEDFQTDDKFMRGVLPDGVYNTYVFHIKASDEKQKLRVTSLIKFHGQTIKGVVWTNGAYRNPQTGEWDTVDKDGNAVGRHLDDSDFFLGPNASAIYRDARWEGGSSIPQGRGVELTEKSGNSGQYISFNCDDAEDCAPTAPPAGSNGDPHFKTWKNEHFEYHGQCDMVLAQDPEFANGVGMHVQIRTKLVRFWSYIKNVAVRIGDDILEIEGSPEEQGRYWINLQYQGKLETLGGFPVSMNKELKYNGKSKRKYEIDLSSKYPGQKIVLSTYKEFVRVDFENGSEDAFGNTVGLLGDFKTGKTLARDGKTVLDDFGELGNEWQVRADEHMLFHDVSLPQPPQKCIEPEDPRGDRRRRLAEGTVFEEEAEKACSHLKSMLDRKDCLYDILATQDLDMVGAY